MRKLLNTLYITKELAYLSLDGENFVCKEDNKEIFRIPFDNIENIVCFNYVGCSPALMGKCTEKKIPINFVAPNGRFLAKIYGETKGNVNLRVQQIDCFREKGLALAQNIIASKIANHIQNIKQTLHNNKELRENEEIKRVIAALKEGINDIWEAKTVDEVIGIEGYCAKEYFSTFNFLLSNNIDISFSHRSKRPPLDEVNALLSFVYTLWTIDYASALETVGLDSYIGFCHALRSGRHSLACDLVEETRYIIERFVITLINTKIITKKDFTYEISGAVLLNEDGRKKVITRWQEKKRSDVIHPYLRKKIAFGLIPYVQSTLLAKYIRGDISEYPPFLAKEIKL